MPKICPRYKPKVCPRHPQDMPKICPKYAQDIPQDIPQDMAKICPRSAQDLPKICPRYAQDTPKICPRYSQNMPKICPRYCQILKNHPLTPTWIEEMIAHLKTASTCLVVWGFHVRVRVAFWQELQVWWWGRTLPGQTKVFQLHCVRNNVLDFLVGLF